MENSLRTGRNDETPIATPERASNQKLLALIKRRDDLEKQVSTFGGVPADASILDDLEKQIADLQKGK